MKKLIVLILVFATLEAQASLINCTSNITKELEVCARKNFEYTDNVLNSVYAEFASKLSASDKHLLIKIEKDWLAYKETHCQNAYDATYPGEEAGIDKWVCHDETTKARIEEIRYLNYEIGAIGFYRALDIIPKLYEGETREKLISKLTDVFSKDDDKSWHSYVEENCKLAAAIVPYEEKATCIARQVFYQ